MTTETVKEEVLGTSIAETVRRTVKIRDGIWWCPFCDRSAQIILHKVCADPQCAAKLTIEGGKLASAIRMVIRTEPVEPQITTDNCPPLRSARQRLPHRPHPARMSRPVVCRKARRSSGHLSV